MSKLLPLSGQEAIRVPTYDYLCESGHEFEAEQSIKDDALTECHYRTGWNEEDLSDIYCDAPCRRLISKTSFKFKGGAPTPKNYT